MRCKTQEVSIYFRGITWVGALTSTQLAIVIKTDLILLRNV